MKRKKRHSVARRLNRWIVIVMLIVMTATVGLISYMSAKVVSFVTSSVFSLFTKLTEEKVNSVLYGVEIAAVNNLAEVEKSLGSPEQVKRAMENELRYNPHLKGCTVAFEPGFFPQKGRWLELHAVRTDSVNIKVSEIGSKEHDYLSASWYKDAMAAGTGYWSDPYFDDADSGLPFCSFSLPIHDAKGNVVGLYEADISLEWLKDRMVEIIDHSASSFFSFSNDGMIGFFIVGRDGTYIIHDDDSLVLKKNYYESLMAIPDSAAHLAVREMKAGHTGHVELEGGPLASAIFYNPMARAGWTMLIEPPRFIISIFGAIFAVVLTIFMLIGLITTIIVVRITVRRIMKPLNKLSESADEVAKGNFHTQLPVIKHRDEIGQLRDSFETMQHSLTEYVEELKTTTAQKASMESELKIASDIQMSMVPKTFPPYPERHDIDILASLTPAKAVGGDLYDFYLRNDKLFFCIGDVSGKGVPAALLMAVARTLFRNVSGYVESPDHILNAINMTMSDHNDTDMFVTLFVGVLDLVSGQLSYANAGHDAPLLIGSGVRKLPCDANLPIGVEGSWQFSLQQTTVETGTTIFLYTDGLTEAENMSHDLFGGHRVKEEAEALSEAGTCSPESVIGRMNRSVHDFVGEAEQSDDLTMLAIYRSKV